MQDELSIEKARVAILVEERNDLLRKVFELEEQVRRLTQRAADEVPAWLCECGRKHIKVHYGFTCLCGAVLRR